MSGPLNILVGGGTGFVGRHLVKCLESHGAKVQVISRDVRKNHISWVSSQSKFEIVICFH